MNAEPCKTYKLNSFTGNERRACERSWGKLAEFIIHLKQLPLMPSEGCINSLHQRKRATLLRTGMRTRIKSSPELSACQAQPPSRLMTIILYYRHGQHTKHKQNDQTNSDYDGQYLRPQLFAQQILTKHTESEYVFLSRLFHHL